MKALLQRPLISVGDFHRALGQKESWDHLVWFLYITGHQPHPATHTPSTPQESDKSVTALRSLNYSLPHRRHQGAPVPKTPAMAGNGLSGLQCQALHDLQSHFTLFLEASSLTGFCWSLRISPTWLFPFPHLWAPHPISNMADVFPNIAKEFFFGILIPFCQCFARVSPPLFTALQWNWAPSCSLVIDETLDLNITSVW